MTVQLADLTRDQIKALAPETTVIWPTAAIEQHGPHLPIRTDTLLCGTIAEQAAISANNQGSKVVVTPVLCYGNSHHHFPFAGTLSLTSANFMAAVTDVLEGLMKSGFKKLLVLNGHGGNTDSNAVVALDFVNRLGHEVAIAAAAYWDVARPALVEHGFMAGARIPGHAGQFETAMVMGLAPELVNQEGLAQTRDVSQDAYGIFGRFSGATVQVHGAWGASTGYTDDPTAATPELGQAMLPVIVEKVAELLVAF